MGLSREKVTELYYEDTWHWVFVGIHILKSPVLPQTSGAPVVLVARSYRTGIY